MVQPPPGICSVDTFILKVEVRTEREGLKSRSAGQSGVVLGPGTVGSMFLSVSLAAMKSSSWNTEGSNGLIPALRNLFTALPILTAFGYAELNILSVFCCVTARDRMFHEPDAENLAIVMQLACTEVLGVLDAPKSEEDDQRYQR